MTGPDASRGRRFADRVVVITGASSGIGAELARQLSAEGAHVALAARDTARLEQVAAECRAMGSDAIVVTTDVSQEASCRAMIDAVVAHYGRLDVLVNNAGVSSSGRFDEVTDFSIFERLMRINYLGSVWCTGYALPHLKRARGLIVGVSSLTGLTGVPLRTAYAPTKHAMAGFFDSLRIELEDSGVGVTMIYPGFVLTEINQRALAPDGTPFGDRAYRRRPGESMPADEATRLIVDAMAERRRELLMTWRGKLGRLFKLVSPTLVDRIARKAISHKQ